MSKELKHIKRTSKGLLMLFFLGMAFSFFVPGKIPIIDDVRLKVESTLLKNAWHIKLHKSGRYISYESIQPHLANISSGSLVFMSNHNCVGNSFIPGRWKHVAVYLGTKDQLRNALGKNSPLFRQLQVFYHNNTEALILDSNTNGVDIHNFKTAIQPNSNSTINEMAFIHLDLNKQVLETFLEKAFQQLGKDYDYDLIQNDTSKLFCSELISISLQKIGVNTFAKSSFLGRNYISPSDLFKQLQDQPEYTLQFQIVDEINKEDNEILAFNE